MENIKFYHIYQTTLYFSQLVLYENLFVNIKTNYFRSHLINNARFNNSDALSHKLVQTQIKKKIELLLMTHFFSVEVSHLRRPVVSLGFTACKLSL